MEKQSTTLTIAGILMFVTAALHLFSLIVGGFALLPLLLFPFGIGYLFLGGTFLNRSDSWARLTLGIMLAGALGAYLLTMLGLSVPSWWLMLIVWTDLAVAAVLLLYFLRG